MDVEPLADVGLCSVDVELSLPGLGLSAVEVGLSFRDDGLWLADVERLGGTVDGSVVELEPSFLIASELPQAGQVIVNPQYFCETEKSCPQEQWT